MIDSRESYFDDEVTFRVTLPSLARMITFSASPEGVMQSPPPSSRSSSNPTCLSQEDRDEPTRSRVASHRARGLGVPSDVVEQVDISPAPSGAHLRSREGCLAVDQTAPFVSERSPKKLSSSPPGQITRGTRVVRLGGSGAAPTHFTSERPYTSRFYTAPANAETTRVDSCAARCEGRIFCCSEVDDVEARAAWAREVTQAAIARREAQLSDTIDGHAVESPVENETEEDFKRDRRTSDLRDISWNHTVYNDDVAHLLQVPPQPVHGAEASHRPDPPEARRVPCSSSPSPATPSAAHDGGSLRRTLAHLRVQEQHRESEQPPRRPSPRGPRQPATLFYPVPARFV